VLRTRVNPRLSGVKATLGIAGLPAFALPDSQAARPAASRARAPAADVSHGRCRARGSATPHATLAASPGVEDRDRARSGEWLWSEP